MPGLECGKKGSGPILSNFFGSFFQFFMGKKIEKSFFENIVASALKSCIEKWEKKIFFGGKIFFSEKPFFFGLKFEWNLSVNTERSGTDYCWLYCELQRPARPTLRFKIIE